MKSNRPLKLVPEFPAAFESPYAPDHINRLQRVANHLRIASIRATTASQSGHPTSCCSAADLVAALFFHQMRLNPADPAAPDNDRFILSKGHAAPLLYAVWAELGQVEPHDLENLRKLDSPLEGHPTPRLPFVDVATGSLGQGLSAGAGMALAARLEERSYLTYVLLGDGECAEGSVWEAAAFASTRGLSNLIALVDVNRFGQSQETALGHHMEAYRRRFEAFGWRTAVIDGHNTDEILRALASAGEGESPYVILARTLKGKGIPGVEDQPDWHGKVLKPEQAEAAVAALEPGAGSAMGQGLAPNSPEPLKPLTKRARPPSARKSSARSRATPWDALPYLKNDRVATRKAFGTALVRLGSRTPELVVLDGDVQNSTYTEFFEQKFPERFIQCYIAEQNMIGVAAGLASRGRIPFVATFAAFLTRCLDQIRMAAISRLNLKICGTHAGVSIGEDGPSQMGLEDLAIFRAVPGSTVLYPADAVSTERLMERIMETPGLCYLRATRAPTSVIYGSDDHFEIGGAKILRQSPKDQLTVVAAGITLFEALKACEVLAGESVGITVIDAYSVKPLARDLIAKAAKSTGKRVLVVEDHYAEGGLGDAVAGELSELGIQVRKLAVREIPHSGTEAELLAHYGIDALAIAAAVREWVPKVSTTRSA